MMLIGGCYVDAILSLVSAMVLVSGCYGVAKCLLGGCYDTDNGVLC